MGDIDDLVNKSKLADAENLDIMICIHYSDWWADPSNQTKPAAWVGLSVSQLETAVYNHTSDILNALEMKILFQNGFKLETKQMMECCGQLEKPLLVDLAIMLNS